MKQQIWEQTDNHSRQTLEEGKAFELGKQNKNVLVIGSVSLTSQSWKPMAY